MLWFLTLHGSFASWSIQNKSYLIFFFIYLTRVTYAIAPFSSLKETSLIVKLFFPTALDDIGGNVPTNGGGAI